MRQNPQKGNGRNSALWWLVFGSSILSCGLLIPLWLIVGLVVLIIQELCPTPKPTQPKVIYPNNEHAGDWQFKFYDIED